MRYLIFCLLSVCMSVMCRAGDTTIVNVRSCTIVSNQVNNFSFTIQLFLDLGGKTIDGDYWLDSTRRPGFEFVYTGLTQPVRCSPLVQLAQVNAGPGQSGVGLKISKVSDDFISFFNATGDSTINVRFTTDILMQFTDGSFGKISMNAANAQIGSITLSTDDRSGFAGALKNFFYYQNKSDFGVEPNNNSSNNTVYFLTMRMQNAYNFNKKVACRLPSSGIYWNFDSRISTNTGDSLNYVKFYPLNLQLSDHNSYSYDLSVQLGNESDQLFWNKRVSLNLKYTTIIPNLVNLTTAGSGRIRLKPVVTLGVRSYYDYSNQQPHFFSGQLFGNTYYYIPIFDHYSIILEGCAFYDFSTQRNASRKISGNYTITVGAELPKTGFKAMFKYISGETDINFKTGQVIALGLLMDFVHDKD
jgi:hypothetical protein